MTDPDRVTLDDFNSIAFDPETNEWQPEYTIGELPPLRVVTLGEFISVTEDVTEPLIGTADEALLPADGTLLMYGDGGAGKTTLSVDALAHIASGTDWLGIPVRSALRVLLIENEGPRGPFRRRLAQKVAGWAGEPFQANVHTLEEPWTRFTLKETRYREALGAEIDRTESDLVIVGPLASIGARGTGTPDDINEFSALVDHLRAHTQRRFALWIVHHENKAGDVSGAWERYPDTLVHVSAQGNGKTRVGWRKVRWSSQLHNTAVHLKWAANSGYEIDDKPARDYRAEILSLYERDNEWRTVNQIKAIISANADLVRPVLETLHREGIMSFQTGPPGRNVNARCYRLGGDSKGASHPESPALFEGGGQGGDSLTPPFKGSRGASQVTPHPSTDPRTPESPPPPDDGIPW